MAHFFVTVTMVIHIFATDRFLEPKPLIMSPVAKAKLASLFTEYTREEIEFAFCAYGRENTHAVYVDHIKVAKAYEATYDEIYYKRCTGPGLLGDGHAHLNPDHCRISLIDQQTVVKRTDQYMILVCTDIRLRLYSKRSLVNRLASWEIAAFLDK